MKKINVESRDQIKQLLYDECVFGIKDDKYRAFGGFQLWWYDKRRGVCDSCESHWSDPRKKLHHHSLEVAAKILWRHRHELYMRARHADEDHGLQVIEHLEDVGH